MGGPRIDRWLSRRSFVRGGVALASAPLALWAVEPPAALSNPLAEFGYDQVELHGSLQLTQRENVTAVLLSLDEDSLLMPFRAMSGQAAPGISMGGWYEWNPEYDHHHSETGLAPGHSFGQWTSAMARLDAAAKAGPAHAGAGNAALAAKAMRLNHAMGQAVRTGFFAQTRFAGYTLDKLACGLMDGHRLLGDPAAFDILNHVADVALPVLPGHAIEREVQWRNGRDLSWMWDETYTMPENLYLLSALGAGTRYRQMADAYLMNEGFFTPLSQGVNGLSDLHAYSHVNALCSAMQAYLVGGSRMHLQAAVNGFAMLEQQSFATGGWGPEETLRKPGYDELAKSLSGTHNHFETPCGSYAHMKLTRYLLRATRDGHYGDSMECVMLNTVLGALPLMPDGRSFYHSDYNQVGQRVYSKTRWPCCAGTLPQVVADYGINSYLREPGAVWVNLYQPSTLRWNEGPTVVTLEQTGDVPYSETVELHITAARPVSFALQLRIPAWAEGASLRINGTATPLAIVKGFASVARVWRSGDRLELRLPASLRLVELPANGGPRHQSTVALMWGPVVLFVVRASNEVGPLKMDASALLKAERTAPREWRSEDKTLVPFTELGERMYATYVDIA